VAELKLAYLAMWIVSTVEWMFGTLRLRCEDWCNSAEHRLEARRG
jgi:hypothetical protein